MNKIIKDIDSNVQLSNLTLEKEINQKELANDQKSFLKTNLGKAINKGIDIGLKVILPDFIEDEIIEVKNSLITEGFSAAVDTAIEEATSLGKSVMGIVTGNFESVEQIRNAIKKGGLIDTVSGLVGDAIDWAKSKDFISKGTANIIKNGKEAIIDTIESGIKNTLDNQIEAIEKIDRYIEKWQTYYNEKNFKNMEYQYNKIQKYLKEVIPLEKILEKAHKVETLHELIKNNGKNFNITPEEKELAEIL